MTTDGLIEHIMDVYYNPHEEPTESILKILNVAEGHFGKEFVELQCGLENQSADARQQIKDFIKYSSVRNSQSGLRYDVSSIIDNPSGRADNYESFTNGMIDVLEKGPWTKWALIIYFPYRIIKNEKGNTIRIDDLFVRIPLRRNTIGSPRNFLYMRSTYPFYQYVSGYKHSHTPAFSRTKPYMWSQVCTGTGPINMTCMRIENAPDFDEDLWKIFFWELDKITEIESDEGGPYMRMNTIGNEGMVYKPTVSLDPIAASPQYITDFITSYLKTNRLKLVYRSGRFCLKTSFLEWLLDFTDYYIHWANVMVDMFDTSIVILRSFLEEYHIKNNQLVVAPNYSGSRRDAINLNNENIPTIIFKGKTFIGRIADLDNMETKTVRLFRYEDAASILYSILQTLNFKYEEAQNTPDTSVPTPAKLWENRIKELAGETHPTKIGRKVATLR